MRRYQVHREATLVGGMHRRVDATGATHAAASLLSEWLQFRSQNSMTLARNLPLHTGLRQRKPGRPASFQARQQGALRPSWCIKHAELTRSARFQSLPAAAHRGVHAAVALRVALCPQRPQLGIAQPRGPDTLLRKMMPVDVDVIRRPLALHIVCSGGRSIAAGDGLARRQVERRHVHCRSVC